MNFYTSIIVFFFLSISNCLAQDLIYTHKLIKKSNKQIIEVELQNKSPDEINQIMVMLSLEGFNKSESESFDLYVFRNSENQEVLINNVSVSVQTEESNYLLDRNKPLKSKEKIKIAIPLKFSWVIKKYSLFCLKIKE